MFAVQSAVYMRERGSADLYPSFRILPSPNHGFIGRTNARPVMRQTFCTKDASQGVVQAFKTCSSETALYDTTGSHSHI